MDPDREERIKAYLLTVYPADKIDVFIKGDLTESGAMYHDVCWHTFVRLYERTKDDPPKPKATKPGPPKMELDPESETIFEAILNEVEANLNENPTYVERQLKRLLQISSKQSQLMKDGDEEVEKSIRQIAGVLSKHASNTPTPFGLLHGDYKIDNLILEINLLLKI